MIILATHIREGMVLNVNNEPYKVTWTMHRTPGKGDACIQTKLKHVINGKNLENRFRSSDKVEKLDIVSKPMQFLYNDGTDYIFMDDETFEQFPISKELIKNQVGYLKEGNPYSVQSVNSTIIGLELPKSIVLEVIDAPPEIKKATASSSLRPVTVENNLTIQVPAFIKTGDKIKINTENASYIERV